MVEVKAFVGHSFTDGDKEVVSQFLEYFDAAAKLFEEAAGGESNEVERCIILGRAAVAHEQLSAF